MRCLHCPTVAAAACLLLALPDRGRSGVASCLHCPTVAAPAALLPSSLYTALSCLVAKL